jgi:tRNA (mo5U34)-methyltransferase
MQSSRSAVTAAASLPPAPADFDAATFFDDVHWHQRWPLFHEVYTPGVNPVLELCDWAELPRDLTGRRVLDIGPWNGCFSFECERRGAAEVVACGLENPQLSGFTRLKDLLGSRVEYVQESVYHLSPERLGRFDVILFFGVLYHLRYPLLAIDRLRTVSRDEVYIETFTTSSRHLLARPLERLGRWLGLGRLFRSTPLWRQFRAFEIHPHDQSNWFGPNVAAVLEAFASAGFAVRHLRSWGGGTRSSFRATVLPRVPERLRLGCYEGVAPCHVALSGIEGEHVELFAATTGTGQRQGAPLK